MFSPSALGGSICLRCQIRAVARRAPPLLAAAQARGRRPRQYASNATNPQPEDATPVAEIRENCRDTEHWLAEPQQSQSNETSPYVVAEQNLPDPPRGTPENSLGLPDGGILDAHALHSIHGSIERFQEPETEIEHLENTISSGPDYRVKDGKHEEQGNHEDSSTGPPREIDLSKDAGVSADLDSAGEYRIGPTEGNLQTELETNHGINTRAGSDAIILEETGTSRGMADKGRSEHLVSPLIRRTGERKRRHRRGAMVLVEDASRLGVESLGKEVEVIVLRDGGIWGRKSPPVEASPRKEDNGMSLMETMADMLGENVSSADDIEKNIDGLKPEHQILSAREFKSLFTTLMSGFTILQLENYIVWHREQSILENIKDETFGDGEAASEKSKPPEDMLFKHQEYAWMTERAHWIPRVDGAVEEAQYPLTGYITKSMSPKQRLVIQLMRECWNVSIQELLDGDGYVDIRVRDLEFKLLTLGTQRLLQRISRLLLKEGQQIEVRRSSNLIRINAPKAVAGTCVRELDETLRKTKTKAVRLDQVPMQHLDSGILEDLQIITNSVIQLGPHGADGEEILVSWIDLWDEQAQSMLENKADMVFRLLLTSRTSARTSNVLAVYPDVQGKGRLLEDRNNKEKLYWKDRRMEWARLCLPLTSKRPRTTKGWPLTADVLPFKVEPTEEDLALPSSTYQQKLDEFYQNVSPIGIPRLEEEKPRQLQQPETTNATPPGWRPFKITTSAAFGHVLHLNKPKLVDEIAGPDLSTSLATWPRTFTPLTPPVTEIDLPAWSPYTGTQEIASTVLMRFVPCPEDAKSSIHTARAPPLELRLGGDSSKITAIHSLRAINRTIISDILLPAEHIDVRATQQEYAELPPSVIDSAEGMESLVEFLNKSRLNIAKGKLMTPPRLHNLGLPRWLLAPPTSIAPPATGARATEERAGAKKAKKKQPQHLPHTPEGNELRRVSYVFAGLEQRYAVETTYEGWKLVYTAIEAGTGGGRRAELSLEAVPGYDVELRRAREHINADYFLRAVYKLATGRAGHLVERANGEEQVRSTIRWMR